MKKSEINAITTPTPNINVSAFPIKYIAFFLFPAPILRLNPAAPPIPNASIAARHIVVRGNAIFVAALPNSPTVLPIKNWSTILYKEVTSIDIMLGIANFLKSLPTGSVPNGLTLSFSILISFPKLHFLAKRQRY